MRFVLSALALALVAVAPATAGDDGLTGYWKLSIFERGQQTAFWLMKLESKDGKVTATADALRGAPDVKISDAKIIGDRLTMMLGISSRSPMGGVQTIKLDYEGKLPKPGAKKILGTIGEGKSVIPVVMEATAAKNEFELGLEVLKRTPTDPRSFDVMLDMIERGKEKEVTPKELQEYIDSSLKAAELYGPRMQAKHSLRLLEAFQPQKAYADIAAETARRVSKQLDAKAPLDTQLQVLTTVASVLRNAKQGGEAAALETRIEKLEGQAYADYQTSALNYKIGKFAGRKAKSNRAVLVELFTGAQCPPCVAADMAFDGVEKTYAPGEVVLLQYHMHIPRPEPMSNPDSDLRFEFYNENYQKKVKGTPAALFNGKPDGSGGGLRDDAGERYKEYCEVVNKLLEIPDAVKLSASAIRKGDKIAITAKVDGLAKPAETVRLRIALVEDWVRYKGGNGLQYHHRVVRAMPGGAKGLALKEKASEHTVSVDLEELRKKLNKYLDEDYPDGVRPMRLRNLNVVAFVQNDESTEVLQAVNVAVKEE